MADQEQMIDVFSPDGQRGQIPASQAKSAFLQGQFKFAVPDGQGNWKPVPAIAVSGKDANGNFTQGGIVPLPQAGRGLKDGIFKIGPPEQQDRYDIANDPKFTDLLGHSIPTQQDLYPGGQGQDQGPSMLQTTKQFGKELLSGARQLAFYKPSAGESAAHYAPAESVVGSMVQSGQQAVQQAKQKQYGRATVSGLSAVNPFAAPAVSQINELESQGRSKEAEQRALLNVLLLSAGSEPVRGIVTSSVADATGGIANTASDVSRITKLRLAPESILSPDELLARKLNTENPLKPGSGGKLLQLHDATKTAVPLIRDAATTSLGGPITSADDAIAAIQKAKDDVLTRNLGPGTLENVSPEQLAQIHDEMDSLNTVQSRIQAIQQADAAKAAARAAKGKPPVPTTAENLQTIGLGFGKTAAGQIAAKTVPFGGTMLRAGLRASGIPSGFSDVATGMKGLLGFNPSSIDSVVQKVFSGESPDLVGASTQRALQDAAAPVRPDPFAPQPATATDTTVQHTSNIAPPLTAAGEAQLYPDLPQGFNVSSGATFNPADLMQRLRAGAARMQGNAPVRTSTAYPAGVTPQLEPRQLNLAPTAQPGTVTEGVRNAANNAAEIQRQAQPANAVDAQAAQTMNQDYLGRHGSALDQARAEWQAQNPGQQVPDWNSDIMRRAGEIDAKMRQGGNPQAAPLPAKPADSLMPIALGKLVTVQGQNGTISGMYFDQVRVTLDSGKTINVYPENVQPRQPAPPTNIRPNAGVQEPGTSGLNTGQLPDRFKPIQVHAQSGDIFPNDQAMQDWLDKMEQNNPALQRVKDLAKQRIQQGDLPEGLKQSPAQQAQTDAQIQQMIQEAKYGPQGIDTPAQLDKIDQWIRATNVQPRPFQAGRPLKVTSPPLEGSDLIAGLQSMKARADAAKAAAQAQAPGTATTVPTVQQSAKLEAIKQALSRPAAPMSNAPQTALAGQYGSDASVMTSTGSLPGRYKVVEADSLIPSHNAMTFAKNPDYPAGVQERAYDTSKEAQNRVIQQAQNYEPAYTVNTNPDAVNGPPVVTPNGTVLGGNSRTMSTQRLYQSGQGAQYRNYLTNNSQQFGISPEQLNQFKNPVLVREIDAPASLDEARRLGSDLNKSMTGSLGVTEKAVSAGKNISPATIDNISAMFRGTDETASLRDILRAQGKNILGMLTEDGVITDRERPQYVDTATGGLSEEGKNFVERALMGNIVDDPRLMDSAPKNVLSKLERSLGDITSVSSRTDEYNILPLVREALAEHADIAQKGSTVNDYLAQPSMFGAPRNAAVDAIVRKLAEKPTMVSKAMRDFATEAAADVPGQSRMVFGPQPSPANAFNHAFGTNFTDEQFTEYVLQSLQKEGKIGTGISNESPSQKGNGQAANGGLRQNPAGPTR